jgi:hypothetical protein
VDATKGMFRKKREKLQKFEYKLVQSDLSEPVAPKVLPKVCRTLSSAITFREMRTVTIEHAVFDIPVPDSILSALKYSS